MKRFRKFRISAEVRDKHAETALKTEDLIQPYFVIEGSAQKEPIKGFEGVDRYTPDYLAKEVLNIHRSGINKILLFGIITEKLKTANGGYAWSDDGPVPQAIRLIKKTAPTVEVIADVCLCAYTKSGHCGITVGNEVINDTTLPLLAKAAVCYAGAGADIVAPSAMMDGQVSVIRKALDKDGFKKVKILAYSAKYASNFYGPFRSAAKSAPSSGDRKTYQMDYRNIEQALGEIQADIEEGADMVMVKPAHTYLDVIRAAADRFKDITIAAYHVSGECAMIKAGAKAGLFDEQKVVFEVLTAVKRAGAKYIISYYAKEAAKWLA